MTRHYMRFHAHSTAPDTTNPVVGIDPITNPSSGTTLVFTGTVTDNVAVTTVDIVVKNSALATVATLTGTVLAGIWSASWTPVPAADTGFTAVVTAADSSANTHTITSAAFDIEAAPSHAFDDGQPGQCGDMAARADFWWNIDKTYFEPRHSAASATPTRTIHATTTGTGDGTSGSPTSVDRYLSGTGVTPTAGDQVRIYAGNHTISSSPFTVAGTAANPIRFVRDDPSVAPVLQNSSTNEPVLQFGYGRYLGFHGIDIDGQNASQWGIVFGRRFTSQTGMFDSHFVDFWHCNSSGTRQECVMFNGGSGLLSNNFHAFGGSVHDSGADGNINQYGELFYFGNGNDTSDHADHCCVEAVEMYNASLGEAVDFKQQQTGSAVMGCYIHDIDVHSQGSIVAQTSEIDVRYTVIHNVRESTDVTTIPAWSVHYEAHGIVLQGGVIDHCIIFDTDGSAVAVYDHLAVGGTQVVEISNTTIFRNRELNTGYQSDMLHWGTSTAANGNGYAAVTIADCISEDVAGTSPAGAITNPELAVAADFVGPIVGTTEQTAGQPGTGFELDGGSSIPATAGALDQGTLGFGAIGNLVTGTSFTFTGGVPNSPAVASMSLIIRDGGGATVATLTPSVSGISWSAVWNPVPAIAVGFTAEIVSTDVGAVVTSVTSAPFDTVAAPTNPVMRGSVVGGFHNPGPETITAASLSTAPVAGDRIVGIMLNEGPSPSPTVTWTDGGGTLIVDVPGSGYRPRMRIVDLGTYAGETDWTLGGSTKGRVAIVALDGGSVFAASAGASGNSPVDPGSVANAAGSMCFAVYGTNWDDGDDSTFTSIPAGHTEVGRQSGIGNAQLLITSLVVAAAGTYDPGAVTFGPSSEQMSAVSFVVS